MIKRTLFIAARIAAVFITLVAVVLVIMFTVNIILGTKPYIVSTDSMSDTLFKGDMIFVKEINPSGLKEGDIITYTMTNSNIVVTHRVVRIEEETGFIITKGDNNQSEDAPALPENLIGLYVYKIPGFKFLVKE